MIGNFHRWRGQALQAFSRASPQARRDLVLISAFGAIVYLYALRFDLFDRMVEWHDAVEHLELDELVMAIVIASFCLIAFSIRRMGEASRDLQLRLTAEEQTKAMATHDALTGLPNRRKMYVELEEALNQALTGEMVAVAVVDLDRFKPVNDLYGHAAGDALLVALAEMMVDEVEPHGFVARFGGDEFVLVWRNLKNMEDLVSKLTQLSSRFEAPMPVGANQIAVGASIGVVAVRDEVLTTTEALRRADIALFRVKEDGRGRFAFFDDSMDIYVQARHATERQLRDALARDAIEPFFQPLVRLDTNAVYGYEVLARLRRVDGSIVPPSVFIPIAEETGLIAELTYAILRRACTEARDWPGAPLISVNISPVQLRDDALPQKLLKVLVETGYPASRLQVEITENALVADLDQARAILTSLRNQGVLIALDDFGTGYSSLRHLRELPFDNLKIDGSFVQAMDDDAESASIVTTILDLARNLGITVTAEGIETELSAEHLREMGCTTGQGFLFGYPAEAHTVREALTHTPAVNESTKVA